jgi:hypothetical protein
VCERIGGHDNLIPLCFVGDQAELAVEGLERRIDQRATGMHDARHGRPGSARSLDPRSVGRRRVELDDPRVVAGGGGVPLAALVK